MSRRKPLKLGDVTTLLRSASAASHGGNPNRENADGAASDALMVKRQVLAEFCRLAGARLGSARKPHPLETGLTPRVRQTLECLLSGDSEKEIAHKLGISRHTIHVYVKTLHRRFGVSSRGELLAKWVQTS